MTKIFSNKIWISSLVLQIRTTNPFVAELFGVKHKATKKMSFFFTFLLVKFCSYLFLWEAYLAKKKRQRSEVINFIMMGLECLRNFVLIWIFPFSKYNPNILRSNHTQIRLKYFCIDFILCLCKAFERLEWHPS